MTVTESDKEVLRAAHRAMVAAMLAQDVAGLDALLEDGYVLTHMTGFRQPKAEWLAAVASGAMRYHAARERAIEVEVDGDRAEVIGRDVVEATIYGAHGTWNLQLVTDLARHGGEWRAARTVASTF